MDHRHVRGPGARDRVDHGDLQPGIWHSVASLAVSRPGAHCSALAHQYDRGRGRSFSHQRKLSEPFRRGTLLQHGGGGYWYLTYQMWTPEYQLGVVVLTNSTSGNLPVQTAWGVLQQMIDAKYGPVPRRGPAKFTDKPVITLETKLLQRLEGTYKPRGAVVTFKVKENSLYRVSGTTDEKLNAH